MEVVAGASAIEREVLFSKTEYRFLTPCPPLTPSWFPNDGSGSDYRLARAVAGIAPWGESTSGEPSDRQSSPSGKPVAGDQAAALWVWDETTRSAVWARGASLESNLAAVLRRRLIDAERGVGDGFPLWSLLGAGFQDILALWRGEVDEQRLAELIHALSLD